MSDDLSSARSVRRAGFTLVELMVVAAVIVCLLVVTVPALRSMVNSGQQAQALNVIRANLLMVRDFALTHSVPAGVRFQDDGRIVPIYATNAGLHDAANYRTANNGQTLPGQAGNPFQMATIPAMAPAMMPGAYRVVPLDYTYSAYNSSAPGVGIAGWMVSPDWFTGQQWYLTSVILFSSRGKAIQAQVQFPSGWAPANTGSYAKWLSPTTYAYQGGAGAGCDAHTHDITGGILPMTGPSVATDFRIYDAGSVANYMTQAAQPATPNNGYTWYPPNEQLTEAYRLMEETGSDFIVDSNTGRMIRKGADLAVEQ
jgi:prepilin-type N-terminal cleavage/methylation domain-containing protein